MLSFLLFVFVQQQKSTKERYIINFIFLFAILLLLLFCHYLEKPCNFDPFGQTGFAPVGHNIFDPCKVLAQGAILFYPFRYSGFSLPLTYACSHRIILWYAPYEWFCQGWRRLLSDHQPCHTSWTMGVRCQIKVHNCKYSYLLCNFILLFSELLLLIEFCFIVSLILFNFFPLA